MTTATESTSSSAAELRARWEAFKAGGRRVFLYDGAKEFGVSEAELLATYCGDTVTRLDVDFQEFLPRLNELGEVMALTRNEWAVMEKRGAYSQMRFQGHMGIVFDPGIDLRLFMSSWATVFAVENPDAPKYKFSFQFFNRNGLALHKVFMEAGCEAKFQELRDAFRSGDQSTVQKVEAASPAPTPIDPSDVDIADLRSDWMALQDTHDFYPMLKKHSLSRTAAYRLVGEAMAEELDPKTHRPLLEAAAATEVPIMVFVGNSGCIEIHTGEIKKLVDFDSWFNIMDPGFTLHLNEAGVHEAWLVRKPTKDGIVTSVELYDAEGNDIAFLFGKRKPGSPELESWRALAENTTRLSTR